MMGDGLYPKDGKEEWTDIDVSHLLGFLEGVLPRKKADSLKVPRLLVTGSQGHDQPG